jgi:RNA polymerase sigma-70 factor (ECF subfamily)
MDWPFKTTDEQAMWRVQQHDDHAAFSRLVAHWEQPIRRLCARMLGDSHRAEDLTQEAFTRVFAHRREFDVSGRFSTWLWRIAVNLCHDELRRRKRRPEQALMDDDGEASSEIAGEEPAPDESMVRAEKLGEVRSALQQLGEPYRTVVVLRHYENLKFCEIAEVLGIPEGTVKSRMAEGLSRLSRRLGPQLHGRAARANSGSAGGEPPFGPAVVPVRTIEPQIL